MELPINFPDEGDAIYEEALKFRSLSPEQQVAELDQAFLLYRFLRDVGGRPEMIDRLADEEEKAGHLAMMEFARRHA